MFHPTLIPLKEEMTISSTLINSCFSVTPFLGRGLLKKVLTSSLTLGWGNKILYFFFKKICLKAQKKTATMRVAALGFPLIHIFNHKPSIKGEYMMALSYSISIFQSPKKRGGGK